MTDMAHRYRSGKSAYLRAEMARIMDGAALCPHHWKKLARITPEGIELWCKCEHGHTVFLGYEDIEKARERWSGSAYQYAYDDLVLLDEKTP